jgi:hypothetical protein
MVEGSGSGLGLGGDTAALRGTRFSRTEERSITGLYQGIHGGESEPKVILLWRVKITMIFPRLQDSTSRLPAHRDKRPLGRPAGRYPGGRTEHAAAVRPADSSVAAHPAQPAASRKGPAAARSASRRPATPASARAGSGCSGSPITPVSSRSAVNASG